ncbi:DUF6049 family protein [Streptomonospora nanhaiensis]|uniref:DUF6049 family protein n=1 Tax=Streptomonospora nanhaiensis TaxID=1323731 RepID=UPI001C380014|nr:DUF6049 family protein [Streptomonospora nanhaiensis]MBV2364082.1 hypothetical protein [Streptomonospora nanhaiensis]
MRRLLHVGAVAATTAALLPALAAFSPAQAPAADPGQADNRPDPLVVEEITPTSVGRNSTVEITGEVTNTTERAVEDVTVRFRYSTTGVADRSELDAYAAGEGVQPEPVGADTEIEGGLEPGESAEFTLRVEAADLDLSEFGVYPMVVEAVNGAGADMGAKRTFLPYRGGSAPDPVGIAWVWPLMDRPQRADDDTYLGGSLTESLAPEGRLGRLLTAGAQNDDVSLDPAEPGESAEPTESAEPSASASPSPGGGADDEESGGAGSGGSADSPAVPVTWAVDPGLLDDIDRLTSPYQVMADDGAATAPADMEASAAAEVWLDQARAALADDAVIATPYASADLAALLRHDLDSDAETAIALGYDTVERVLGLPAEPALAVPADGMLNTPTRELYQRMGATGFLLREAAMPAASWVGHTPSAAAPLDLGEGEEGTALVADSGLTEVLDADTSDPGDAALAQQRFAAETAMIAAERPGTDRTVVAYPPADWNPGAGFAQGVLEATDTLPWLEPVDLNDVRPEGGAAGQDRTGPEYPRSASRAELSGSYLDEVKDIRGNIRLFNSILVDEEDPFRPAVLRLESVAWRERDDLSETAVDRVADAVRTDMEKVRIIPSEPVTLASATGTIGVLIANDLEDHTVRVNLSLLSANPERLAIGNYQDPIQDPIEIGPGDRTTVYVRLTARVNGRTMIQMNLHNISGEPIAEEQFLSVNATGMGTQALVISGAGALVLVAALTPRALRKWRRGRETAAAAEPPEGTEGTESAEDAEGAVSEGTGTAQQDTSAGDGGAAPGESPAPMQENEEEPPSTRPGGPDTAPPSGGKGGTGDSPAGG